MLDTHRITNKRFGKWNGIFASNGDESFVFYQNHSLLFPEPLDIWVRGISKTVLSGTLSPVRLDIDITNACCNDCIMCFAQELRKNKAYITLPKLKKIFRDFKESGGYSVKLMGGGEPLMYPQVSDVLECLGSLQLMVTLETNGDLLSVPAIRSAVAKHVHHLRISVNSGDDITRKNVHRPTVSSFSYEALLENINGVRRDAVRLGRHENLFLGTSFVVLPENYKKVGTFINDMHTVGINWVSVKHDVNKSTYKKAPQIISYVEDQLRSLPVRPDFVVEGPYGVSFSPKSEFDTCWVSYVRPVVLADASLQLCPLSRNGLIPKARVGYIEDRENPFSFLISQRESIINAFQSAVPQSCGFCLDKDNNISFSHMAHLLRCGGFSFSKANVQINHTSDDIEKIDRLGIRQIATNSEDFEVFRKGGLVQVGKQQSAVMRLCP